MAGAHLLIKCLGKLVYFELLFNLMDEIIGFLMLEILNNTHSYAAVQDAKVAQGAYSLYVQARWFPA
jgi:hypothetical protein